MCSLTQISPTRSKLIKSAQRQAFSQSGRPSAHAAQAPRTLGVRPRLHPQAPGGPRPPMPTRSWPVRASSECIQNLSTGHPRGCHRGQVPTAASERPHVCPACTWGSPAPQLEPDGVCPLQIHQRPGSLLGPRPPRPSDLLSRCSPVPHPTPLQPHRPPSLSPLVLRSFLLPECSLPWG